MKLDSNAVIPIGWVFTVMAVVGSSAVAGTFWVASINFRLSRIEHRLGIQNYGAESALIPSAGASENKNDSNSRRSRN
jgi:hypothetical protein